MFAGRPAVKPSEHPVPFHRTSTGGLIRLPDLTSPDFHAHMP